MWFHTSPSPLSLSCSSPHCCVLPIGCHFIVCCSLFTQYSVGRTHGEKKTTTSMFTRTMLLKHRISRWNIGWFVNTVQLCYLDFPSLLMSLKIKAHHYGRLECANWTVMARIQCVNGALSSWGSICFIFFILLHSFLPRGQKTTLTRVLTILLEEYLHA